MTQASLASPAEDAADSSEPMPSGSAKEIGRFLEALATLLRETIGRFEDVAGRVSDIAVARSGGVNRELIVALQDFDRLQQEFAALGDVLARVGAAPHTFDRAADGRRHAGHEAIAAVSISHLKTRFLEHMRAIGMETDEEPAEEESIF